ncbi:TPA: ribosome biogenesis GTPase YqeH, partial [Streptococcus equi subsp. equi]|nr:ribosome biogenesis GTPase YqeH [Streptococcus equi subsp. equi]
VDVVFSGLGWIRVNANKETATKVAAWAPDGVAVVVRKAII